jgi:hypothetical protein
MTINVYDKGDLVQLPASFVNDSNVATDPTGVSVKVMKPDGTTVTYTYLTDVEVVKDSTGNYHLDLAISLAGVYKYKWFGTGAVTTAEGGQFTVKPSPI